MYVVCMARQTKKIEIGLNEVDIDRILGEGIQCGAQVEIGECVDCLLAMFDGIQDSQLVKGFKQIIGPDKEKYVDEFLMLLLVSEVATITNNFKDRDNSYDGKDA